MKQNSLIFSDDVVSRSSHCVKNLTPSWGDLLHIVLCRVHTRYDATNNVHDWLYRRKKAVSVRMNHGVDCLLTESFMIGWDIISVLDET